MLPNPPPAWALEAGAVDPRFRKFWHNPAFVLSPWHWDRAYDLVNRAEAAQQPASSVGALGRGWNCQDVADDTYVIRWPTSSPNTHIAGPLEFTMFFAYESDQLPGFNAGYALRRNSEWNNGGYAVLLADNDLQFDVHCSTDAQAINTWFNSFSPSIGYSSFIVTRNSDGRVRGYANGVQLQITGEDIAPNEIVAPFDGTGDLRLNSRTEINGRMLTAWVSRGVSVNGPDAAMLHSDPWAIFRPAPPTPAIFGGLQRAANVGRGRVAMAASRASARVLASAGIEGAAARPASRAAGNVRADMRGDSRLPVPAVEGSGRVVADASADSAAAAPPSAAAARVVVGGLSHTAIPLSAQALQAVVSIVGSIDEILAAARSAAAGTAPVAGQIETPLESPRQAASGGSFSGGRAVSLTEAPGQAVTAGVLASGDAAGRAAAAQLDAQAEAIVGGDASGLPPASLSSAVVRLVVSAEGTGVAPAARQTASGNPLSSGTAAQRVAATVLSVDAITVIRGDIAQQTEAVRQLVSGLGQIAGSMTTRPESPRQAAAGRVHYGATYPARLYIYDDAVVVVDIWDERPPRRR